MIVVGLSTNGLMATTICWVRLSHVFCEVLLFYSLKGSRPFEPGVLLPKVPCNIFKVFLVERSEVVMTFFNRHSSSLTTSSQESWTIQNGSVIIPENFGEVGWSILTVVSMKEIGWQEKTVLLKAGKLK